ncbi:MAG: alginate lyase family protein [bacterium]
MTIIRRIKRALRGEVAARTLALEAVRRRKISSQQSRERATLDQETSRNAGLRAEFAELDAAKLLNHFRSRREPQFFSGFSELASTKDLQQRIFPEETRALLAAAERITNEHSWPVLGLGDQSFGSPIEWHRDLLSGITWPLDYHADINLHRNDGSDVRIVWELNRLPQLLTLARAYAVTNDERFSLEFFQQLASWGAANPLGRGVNWNCAMEVALRAMNLLGALEIFRHSSHLDEARLSALLALFDQHGTFIRKHLEFSHIVTSNHYLSDIVGLLWLGIMLPELQDAADWRDFALRELLSEMDKQVLDDGADFESSTGYHRFVLELFLYSFILCRANAIEIESSYWDKLRRMLEYLAAYLRPDGFAPLIGDSDSGQVFPLCHHSGDDHAYVLAVGAAFCADANLKTPRLSLAPAVLWLLGSKGIGDYQDLEETPATSRSFPDAGTHIQRDGDLYLAFNTSGAGISGRGSHGHNDALSIEVSACGRPFIVDPGTYVYTADLHERHLFRSTAYHSTVEIDGVEQSTIDEQVPFVIGDEAQARVLELNFGPILEVVKAEHRGYCRLPQPVTHQRRVEFNKQRRYWFLSDRLMGEGKHDLSFRFHFAPALDVRINSLGSVELSDTTSGARLLISARDSAQHAHKPDLERQFSSFDYGRKDVSVAACWRIETSLPFELSFVIVPVCAGEDESERLSAAFEFEE